MVDDLMIYINRGNANGDAPWQYFWPDKRYRGGNIGTYYEIREGTTICPHIRIDYNDLIFIKFKEHDTWSADDELGWFWVSAFDWETFKMRDDFRETVKVYDTDEEDEYTVTYQVCRTQQCKNKYSSSWHQETDTYCPIV